MRQTALLFICLVLFTCVPVYAAEKGTMTDAEFEASLKYQKGTIVLPGNMATIKIPDTFRYLSPKDTERVLVNAWGNPSGDGTLGMLFPADTGPTSKNSWGVVITYEEDGHVSDKDADSINYE